MSRYLAITGGVGGAKLALGLSHVLKPTQVLFAVNTGDDFEHLGFTICPDIDTLTYTLADAANKTVGWGREGESWNFMEALGGLGGEDWFRLGDKDLALHVTRREQLAAGATLTSATDHITQAMGIRHRLVPMSDDPVRTIVHTPDGPLAFQHYFVRDRCEPRVTGFAFQGIENAKPNPAIINWLQDCQGVIICPSNPFVSVDPLLNIPGMRDALSRVPVIAVSPIVGGLAIKGPTAKMMSELNVPSDAAQVAAHYGDLLDGFVIDDTDAHLHGTLPLPTVVAQSVMVTLQDRVRLAQIAIDFVDNLRRDTVG